jgi:hypothetical protein
MSDEQKKKFREYYQKNIDKKREYSRRYAILNKDKIKAYKLKKTKLKYEKDTENKQTNFEVTFD